MSTVENIFNYAIRFRTAIENALCYNPDNPYSLDSGFFTFPRGMCTITSDLLGMYLNKQGIAVKSIRSGNSQNNHEWLLTYNGIHIDITCDQFPGYNQKVFFSNFPDDFHKKMFEPFIYEEFNPPYPDSCIYDITIKRLTTIEKHIEY